MQTLVADLLTSDPNKSPKKIQAVCCFFCQSFPATSKILSLIEMLFFQVDASRIIKQSMEYGPTATADSVHGVGPAPQSMPMLPPRCLRPFAPNSRDFAGRRPAR